MENNPDLFIAGHHETSTGKVITWSTEITLLDLFAGMALQGMLADDSDRLDNAAAKEAYETAKAMLEERERITKGETDA